MPISCMAWIFSDEFTVLLTFSGKFVVESYSILSVIHLRKERNGRIVRLESYSSEILPVNCKFFCGPTST